MKRSASSSSVFFLTAVDSVVAGVRAESSSRVAGGPQGFESEGVRGLKALGVRELSYRLAFLACNVAPTHPRVSLILGSLQPPLSCSLTNAPPLTVWWEGDPRGGADGREHQEPDDGEGVGEGV